MVWVPPSVRVHEIFLGLFYCLPIKVTKAFPLNCLQVLFMSQPAQDELILKFTVRVLFKSPILSIWAKLKVMLQAALTCIRQHAYWNRTITKSSSSDHSRCRIDSFCPYISYMMTWRRAPCVSPLPERCWEEACIHLEAIKFSRRVHSFI